MAKALEELFPHKFSVGDTVKVVARGESEWCKVGDTHKVRVCRHDHEDGAVYVVDDDHESAYIRECNLELVERDRQKVGEWKRHRGGKQPVADDVRVEVKLRDGDIQEARARAFLWHHNQCDSYANIMKFRVISQPQAEEVEVDKFVGKDVKLEYALAEEAVDPEGLDWKIIGTANADSISCVFDQIDGPIKWRDTVNELDAYIEEFTREREELINRLAEEGFALLPVMNPVIGGADAIIPIEDWQIGDILEVVARKGENSHEFEIGEHVRIDDFDLDDDNLPVRCYALDESDYWYLKYDEAKFIRRP